MEAFSTLITNSKRAIFFWVDKQTEIAGACKKFCAAEGIQVYSTMGETKAVFAERTIRSWKNFPYCYMEGYGDKYIQNLPKFITTLNSRRNSLIDIRPNTLKNCDFMSILHNKNFMGIQKTYIQNW